MSRGGPNLPDLTPALSVRNIRKSFGTAHILKGLSLDAHQGDVISILGASGSGKSTFLRCINLLEIPDAGEIIVGGETVQMRKSAAMAGWSLPTASRSTASAPNSAWCSRASTCGRT